MEYNYIEQPQTIGKDPYDPNLQFSVRTSIAHSVVIEFVDRIQPAERKESAIGTNHASAVPGPATLLIEGGKFCLKHRLDVKKYLKQWL